MVPPGVAKTRVRVAALLCEAAEGVTFERWRRDVKALADLIDADGGHDPAGDLNRNKLSLSGTSANLHLRCELTADNGLIAEHTLNTIADELFHKFSRDHEESPELELPLRQTLLALALVEACRRAQAASAGGPRTEATIIVTPAGLTPSNATLADSSPSGPGHTHSAPLPGTPRWRLCVPGLRRSSHLDRSTPQHTPGSTAEKQILTISSRSAVITSSRSAVITIGQLSGLGGHSRSSPTDGAPGPHPMAGPSLDSGITRDRRILSQVIPVEPRRANECGLGNLSGRS